MSRSRCRSCHAEILWCATVTGKRIPINAKPVQGGNIRLDGECDCIVAVIVAPGAGTHTSHFATCPHAGLHRKAKGQGSLPGVG